MKVIFNITENKNKATFQQEVVKINTSFNQTENIVKPKFQIGYYPLPSNVDLSNYYTKQEVINNFKPISYNPNIDEVLTNGNNTSHPIIIQNTFGGNDWKNTLTSSAIYLYSKNINSTVYEQLNLSPNGISAEDNNGLTAFVFSAKTKSAYINIPNEDGTIVLDYQLNDFYTQTQIDNLLSNKQDILGFTPEDVANKSDSYTANYSTTYASTKALVDGLATKQKKVTVITVTGNTILSEIHNGAILHIINTCTITIPTGLDPTFTCDARVKGAYIATFVNSGVTLDAPNGLLLKQNKLCTLYANSLNNLNLTGELATS